MNTGISIGSLAKDIMKFMEVDLPINTEQKRVRPDKSEVDRLVCDNSKLLNSSTWKPKYDLASGLTETINWFRENEQLNKPELYHV